MYRSPILPSMSRGYAINSNHSGFDDSVDAPRFMSAGRAPVSSPMMSGNAAPAPSMRLAYQDQPQQVANRQYGMQQNRDNATAMNAAAHEKGAAMMRANPMGGYTAPQPIQWTEQQARAAYGNLGAGLKPIQKIEAFHQLGQKWNFDSHALLDKWTQAGNLGQTQFPTGEMQTSPARPTIDKTMYGMGDGTQESMYETARGAGLRTDYPRMSTGQVGTLPNGQQIMTNAAGHQVGPALGMSTPAAPMMSKVMGPEQGYTPVRSTGTPPMTQAPVQAPFTQDYANQQSYGQERMARADQLDSQAQHGRNTVQPTMREAFNQGGEIAQSYANAPVAAAQARAQGQVQAAATPRTNINVRQGPAAVNAPRKQLIPGNVIDALTKAGLQGSGDRGALTLEDIQKVGTALGYEVGGQQGAPTTQPTGKPADKLDAGQAGTLKPTPQNVGHQYLQSAGGDPAKARELLKRDGYDPDNVQ